MCEAKRKRPLDSEDSSSNEVDPSTSDEDQNSTDSELGNASDDECDDFDSTRNNDDEDEDDVIKAIKRQCENDTTTNHPPMIVTDECVMDICFHPHKDCIAIADIIGNICLYRYTNETNTLLTTFEAHTDSCRSIEFNKNGTLLYSAAKDKSIMIHDIESEKLAKFYDNAHDSSISCLTVIDQNLLSSGDDDGTVKMWDMRMNEAIFAVKKAEDYISKMLTDENKKYLLCASGDGSLATIDIPRRKFHVLSEQYDEELTCLGLFKEDSKLLACSSKGNFLFFNWNEFGLHSDKYPAMKGIINDLVPITEHIVVTASEDGYLRATHIYPHRPLGVVGKHKFSVEKVDICNNGTLIASSSHDNDVNFWNIEYFEQLSVGDKHKKSQKKRELKENLPSSNVENQADFFSGLCS